MTETQTVDLASWLTAVWDEDEAMATGMLRAEIGGFPSPRQTLDRIAADRKILELHSYRMMSSLDSHFQRIPGTEHPCCDTCASQDENGERWPCETIRLLASPYKDREGFQEAWL